MRTTGLCRLRTESKSKTSLRHHTEAETKAALTSALSTASRLLTTALQSRAKAESLTTVALSATSRLLTPPLRNRTEAMTTAALSAASRLLASALRGYAKALTPLLSHSKTEALQAALERSGLPSAEGCLCIHDSGCSDSSEKDPGDCECKNLVHSSLLDNVCGFRFYFIGSSSRIFKNASFPPIQRPASKKISF